MSRLIVNNLQTLSGLAKNGIIQVKTATSTTQYSSTTSTWTSAGLSLVITPVSASSKFYISVTTSYSMGTNNSIQGGYQITRNGTEVFAEGSSLGLNINYYHNERSTHTFSYVDTPATTSAITYAINFRVSNSAGSYDQTFHTNYGGNTGTLVVMEIAG